MAVSHWENGTNEPGSKMYLKLAKMAQGETRDWFAARAENEVTHLATELLGTPITKTSRSGTRQIPVLRDSVAAGTPRAVDEREIAYTMEFPREMIPRSGSLYGVRVEGDSMSPFLETGFIAVVDVSQRSANELVDRMVAAREGDAITIKWLRKQDDIFMLVPQNTSLRHPVRIIRQGGDFSVVGAVIKWIGEPPQPGRK